MAFPISRRGTSARFSSAVPKATLRAHIVERLRAAILAGDIPPGAPLVETALSERFDVSRGPLREALRQLIEEGLVVTVPYTGTHVADALGRGRARDLFAAHRARDLRLRAGLGPRRDDRFRAELQAPQRRADRHHRCRRRPRQHPRPSSSSTASSTRRAATSCCSAPGTACAAACSSTGRRIIARTAGAGPSATATTATSRRRSATISTAMRARDRRPHAPRRGGHGEVSALAAEFVREVERGDNVMTINRRSIRWSRPRRPAAARPAVRARAEGTLEDDQEARHVPRRRHAGAALVLQGSRRPANGRRASASRWARRWPQTLGVKMETVEVSWGNAIAALQGDKIDIMFTIDATAERKQAVDFPESPLLCYSLAVLAKDDLAVKTWEDLNKPGVRIAVPQASSMDRFVDASTRPRPTSSASPTMPRRSPPSSRAASMPCACSIRRCSPRASGSARARSWCRRPPQSQASSAALRKGDTDFVAWVDKQLAEYYKSGQTQKWYEAGARRFRPRSHARAADHERDDQVGGARRLRWPINGTSRRSSPTAPLLAEGLAEHAQGHRHGAGLRARARAGAGAAAPVAAPAGCRGRPASSSRSSAPRRRWSSSSGSSSPCRCWSASR